MKKDRPSVFIGRVQEGGKKEGYKNSLVGEKEGKRLRREQLSS